MPSNEITYAIEADNGQVKVPMLGYPLKKYVIEFVKDSRGKDTKTKTSISKDFLAEATHFSIDVTAPEYFEAQAKINMLPASFSMMKVVVLRSNTR